MPATSWPLAAHFSTILQNPGFAFRADDLKRIEIEKDAHNQPRPRAGAFANVYKGTRPGGKESLAIRVFTSGVPERRERYQAIAQYLNGRRLASLVHFDYTDDGIRSAGDGKWYPLVTMEWVRGEQLFGWLQGRCLDRDRHSLARIADHWVEIIDELSAAHIAHGDLQHGNVMVTDAGKLKLVDYDCMCVPALVGRKNLEIGVDPYQHPDRNPETLLSSGLDNFSALFILVALKALAAAPDLWRTYVEKPQYDKLLFRAEDLRSPGTSSLMQALSRSPDAQVQLLSKELIELSQGKLDQVPPLTKLVSPFPGIEILLDQRDFDGAMELLTRSNRALSEAPPPLQPRLAEACERVKQRAALERAVQAGDEPTMQRLCASSLLDNYPQAQPSMALARQSPQVIPLLARLDGSRQAADWRGFVETWDNHPTLLANRQSAARYASDVATWRDRNRACTVVLQVLGKSPLNAGALSAAWQKLCKVGGHPEVEPERPRIEMLLARHQAWAAFERVPRRLDVETDAKLLAAWNDKLFQGWDVAEGQRPRIVEAQQRLNTVKTLREQAAQPLSAEGEARLVKTAAALPAAYVHEVLARVQHAQARRAALRQFRAACELPISDLVLADRWQALAKLQAQSLVSAEHATRARLAEQRAPLLAAVMPIPADYPIQQAPQLDAPLLAAWNEALHDSHDAQPWLPTVAAARQRTDLFRRLKAAVSAGNRMLTAELSEEPALRDYPLPADLGRAVKLAQHDMQAVRGMLDVLVEGEPSRLLAAFDSRILRLYPARFQSHADRLRQWLPTHVLPAGNLGLALPLGRRGLQAEGRDSLAFRLRWNWPEPRFCERCLVAVCREPLAADEPPSAQDVWQTIPIDRKSYEEGGGSRVFHAKPDWLGGYVAVWAIVDLGFDTFYSEPLVLGQLEAANGQPHGKAKGLFW